jgi:orotidine-5'-phosphate decarboxylase
MKKNNSLVCVGLDSDSTKIKSSQFAFNKAIIDLTYDLVCAYKPNSAFYEARGAAGIEDLKKTCDYLNKKYPDVVLILDAKRADIGNTNNGYVSFAYDYLNVDAITLHPYLGREAIQPFLDQKEKGSIILCRTSNPGAGEFQDGLYKEVATHVAKSWNTNKNCALVVGATYPEELKNVRRIVGDMPLLIPGIGAQGGDVEKTVMFGRDSHGAGMIINSSRGIIFAKNPRLEAQKLRDEINRYR